MLSGAKHLQYLHESKEMQILRSTQDDSPRGFFRSLLTWTAKERSKALACSEKPLGVGAFYPATQHQQRDGQTSSRGFELAGGAARACARGAHEDPLAALAQLPVGQSHVDHPTGEDTPQANHDGGGEHVED